MQKLIVSEIVAGLLSAAAPGAAAVPDSPDSPDSEREPSSQVVSLDALAEAIGAEAVTLQDIEAVFEGLEAAGRRVEAVPQNPAATLARVLATVRSFSAVSGRRPSTPEIAEHSGLTVGEVRFALLYARVLVR